MKRKLHHIKQFRVGVRDDSILTVSNTNEYNISCLLRILGMEHVIICRCDGHFELKFSSSTERHLFQLAMTLEKHENSAIIGIAANAANYGLSIVNHARKQILARDFRKHVKVICNRIGLDPNKVHDTGNHVRILIDNRQRTKLFYQSILLLKKETY